MTDVPEGWRCRGNINTPDGPGECDWPFCGCDPAANKMLAHFQECDLELIPRAALARLRAALTEALDWIPNGQDAKEAGIRTRIADALKGT